MLRKALDSGLTILSTADCYSGFDVGEEVCGNLKFIGKLLSMQQTSFGFLIFKCLLKDGHIVTGAQCCKSNGLALLSTYRIEAY